MNNSDDKKTQETKDYLDEKKVKKVEKKNKLNDKDKIENLKNKILNLKNQRLIDLANLDNQRKQYEKNFLENQKYALSSFIKNLLPSFDMLSLALNSKNVSPEVQNWLKGFEMIEQTLYSELEKVGVKKIEVKIGDKFNSLYHNAIETINANDMENETIIKIITPGYVINDRLLRPVNVVVVKNIKKEDKLVKEKKDKNKSRGKK